jgi:hypothetical protein
LGFFQELGQGIELLLPETLLTLNPLRGMLHRLRHEPATSDATVLLLAQEAGTLEDAEMLRDGGQRHIERLCKLADRGVSLGQPCQYGPPGGVTQCTEDGIQFVGPIFNHLVKYNLTRRSCQELNRSFFSRRV